jgi:hypothetical protein
VGGFRRGARSRFAARLGLVTTIATSVMIVSPAPTGLAAHALTAPNPCKVLPLAALDSAFGLKAGTPITGKLFPPYKGPTGTSFSCALTVAITQMIVADGPATASAGATGGPPGTVQTKPAGLGTNAYYAYNLNPKYANAYVRFTKGSFGASIEVNSGKVAPSKVLALGRILYSKLR